MRLRSNRIFFRGKPLRPVPLGGKADIHEIDLDEAQMGSVDSAGSRPAQLGPDIL